MPSTPAADINDTTLIARDPSPVTADMGDELVMLSIERGNYYGLGEVGSRIWQLLESPRPLNQLVDQLVDEYEIAPDACRRDVLSFLRQLQQEGLLRLEHEPSE